MGLCDGVSTGAEGRAGGQMAFTDLGEKAVRQLAAGGLYESL